MIPAVRRPFVSRFLRSPNVNNDMTEIIPGLLFISSLPTSRDAKLLKKNRIKTIVSVMNDVRPSFPGKYVYVLVPVRDLPSVDIATQAEAALEVIAASVRRGEAVLVHCHCGVSRSVSVVCLYLMRSEGLTFAEALAVVKSRRCQADPNAGFRAQLELM